MRDELKFLENEGITVDIPEGPKKIYFRLALVTGDNLGLHSLLGFTESFNQKIFCRLCLTNRSDINFIFTENQCVLRSELNYEADISKNEKKNYRNC